MARQAVEAEVATAKAEAAAAKVEAAEARAEAVAAKADARALQLRDPELSGDEAAAIEAALAVARQEAAATKEEAGAGGASGGQTWSTSAWVESLPISAVIAAAINAPLRGASVGGESIPERLFVSALSTSASRQALVSLLLPTVNLVADELWKGASMLASSSSEKGGGGVHQSKFAGRVELDYGGVMRVGSEPTRLWYLGELEPHPHRMLPHPHPMLPCASSANSSLHRSGLPSTLTPSLSPPALTPPEQPYSHWFGSHPRQLDVFFGGLEGQIGAPQPKACLLLTTYY